jgi:hypothetical protein
MNYRNMFSKNRGAAKEMLKIGIARDTREII